MHPHDYVKNVLVTESNNFDIIGSRFSISKDVESIDAIARNQSAVRNIRLLHAAIGIATEVGELFEFLDKNPLDFTNLKEEVGDAFWYCGIAVDELKLDLAAMVQAGRDQMCAGHDLTNDQKRTQFMQILVRGTKDSSVLLDLLKKSAFYGKVLDQAQFAQVLSNFVGSMMAILSLAGFSVEEAMSVNIAKLQKRYGDKFTEAAAITRNLEAERKILEGC